MTRYKSGPPIGYKGPFKGMEEIYRDYKNTLMNKGPYRAYFESRASYRESPRNFAKIQYSPEHSPVSEGERKEQQHTTKIKSETKTETQNNIQPELKTAQNNNELSNQKQSEIIKPEERVEQKKELEKQDDVFYNNSSLTKYENDVELCQSDTMSRRRPSPYDKELRW